MPRIQYSWDAPATDSQFGPADHYLWQHRKVGDPWTRPTQVNGTSITIPNLERNTEYEFRVKAVNFVGESADVSTTVMTTSDLPAAVRPPNPTDILVRGEDSAITISWTDTGNTGTDFSVRYRQGTTGDWTVVSSLAQPEHTIIDLVNGQSYQLQVRSANYAGTSAWSATQTETANIPILPPGKIAFIEIETFASSLRASWDAPDDGHASGSVALTYELQYKLSSDTEWVDLPVPNARIVTVTNITTGVNYDFRVRASNTTGEGPWSDVFTGGGGDVDRPIITFSENPIRSTGVTFTQDREGVWHGLTEDDTNSISLQFRMDPIPRTGRTVSLELRHVSGDVSRLQRWADITGVRFDLRLANSRNPSQFPSVGGNIRFGESTDVGGYDDTPSIFEFFLRQEDSYFTESPTVLRFSVVDNEKFKPAFLGFLSRDTVDGDVRWTYTHPRANFFNLDERSKFADNDEFKLPLLYEDWESSGNTYRPTGTDIPASVWRVDFADNWWLEVGIILEEFSDGGTTYARTATWSYIEISDELGEAGISDATIMQNPDTDAGGAYVRFTRADNGATYDRVFLSGVSTRKDLNSNSIFYDFRNWSRFGPHLRAHTGGTFNNKATGTVVIQTTPFITPPNYYSRSTIATSMLDATPLTIFGIRRDLEGTWLRVASLPSPSGTESFREWSALGISGGTPNFTRLPRGGVFVDTSTGNVWHRPSSAALVAYNIVTDLGYGQSDTVWKRFSSGTPPSNIGGPGDWAIKTGVPATEDSEVWQRSQPQTIQEANDLFDTNVPIGHDYRQGAVGDTNLPGFDTKVVITRIA